MCLLPTMHLFFEVLRHRVTRPHQHKYHVYFLHVGRKVGTLSFCLKFGALEYLCCNSGDWSYRVFDCSSLSWVTGSTKIYGLSIAVSRLRIAIVLLGIKDVAHSSRPNGGIVDHIIPSSNLRDCKCFTFPSYLHSLGPQRKVVYIHKKFRLYTKGG